ncbi:MAG: hypothetical protein K0S18_159 [Anaerocolumna sp.]|jgi:hypothetical protein|nr:hypothetical protein [Anaerocolumna sp.]
MADLQAVYDNNIRHLERKCNAMTIKDIIEIAENEDTMYCLEQIKRIKDNMQSKTEYEQKTAQLEIKNWAKRIKYILENNNNE